MALLSADRRQPPIQPKFSMGYVEHEFPVAASTVIYAGGFVALDFAGNLVMWIPPTVGTSLVGGHRLIGIAQEHIASQTAAGKRCRVQIGGYFVHTITSGALAYTGKHVWASDNQTLSLVSLVSTQAVGVIVDFLGDREGYGANDVLVQLTCNNCQSATVSAWSPILTGVTVNSAVLLIHPSQNPNGLFIRDAVGICTTNLTDAVVYTGKLVNTAGAIGASVGLTFTSSSHVAGDKLIASATTGTLIGTADSAAPHTVITAGQGLCIQTTTAQAAGAAKFWAECIPAA